MPTVLHVQASPRGDESVSLRVARAFLEAYRDAHADTRVDAMDLFSADLPPFSAPAAAAKYAVMAGQQPADEAGRAWEQVIRVVERLKAADVLLISSPMWNFGIPYPLKHYIDVIVQPGLTFSFSPESGYSGLVTGRPAVLCLARGSSYAPGSGAEAMDMQRPYLEKALGLIGFTDIHAVIAEPTMAGGPEAARAAVEGAVAEAQALGAHL